MAKEINLSGTEQGRELICGAKRISNTVSFER